MNTIPHCRFCTTPLTQTFVDLGATPLANHYLTSMDQCDQEVQYPLHARVCGHCFLVQVDNVVPPDAIFGHYAYFSSYSSSWLAHAETFVDQVVEQFHLTTRSHVVEVASNDGYLLRNFVRKNIPCLGIEPARNVAEVAIQAGIPTKILFFGTETARQLLEHNQGADLIIANNVLAHVPDLNDFVSGLALLLKPEGVISIECPHLLNLIEHNQFDTIYHEHFSYFSLYTLEQVFQSHGLRVFDVQTLPTHGGSLRFFVGHQNSHHPIASETMIHIRQQEQAAQLDTCSGYEGFAIRVHSICTALLQFLKQKKQEGKHVAAYGAAAKGNTLLNVCHIDHELISFVVDKNPHKQNHLMPGSHIPIFDVEKVTELRPDFLLILPWNLSGEIAREMHIIRSWGGQFVTAIPHIHIW